MVVKNVEKYRFGHSMINSMFMLVSQRKPRNQVAIVVVLLSKGLLRSGQTANTTYDTGNKIFFPAGQDSDLVLETSRDLRWSENKRRPTSPGEHA